MGAASVTGTGMGAGFSNYGPQNGRDVYVPLNSPHVVAAGSVDLVGGVKTVYFSTPLSGGHASYAVMLTANSATTTVSRVTTLTDDGNGNFASFIITGNGTDTVAYAVISVGTGIANLV